MRNYPPYIMICGLMKCLNFYQRYSIRFWTIFQIIVTIEASHLEILHVSKHRCSFAHMHVIRGLLYICSSMYPLVSQKYWWRYFKTYLGVSFREFFFAYSLYKIQSSLVIKFITFSFRFSIKKLSMNCSFAHARRYTILTISLMHTNF